MEEYERLASEVKEAAPLHAPPRAEAEGETDCPVPRVSHLR